MRNWLLPITLSGFALVAGCAPGADSDAGAAEASSWVKMEGTTHYLRQFSPDQSRVTIEGDDIRFFLKAEDADVTINFNLQGTGILETGSASFVLPEANHGDAVVDLNFFNDARSAGGSGRRIRFNEGSIEVEEIGQNRLRMTFGGSGKPLGQSTRFPIEGAIDASF